MAFRDIIGQKKAVEILQRIINRQRLASAYIFTGESGIGKKTTALQLAKTLNCSKTEIIRGENDSFGSAIQGSDYLPDSCDVCESCIKINSGTHPDVFLISPEENQIRIEEMRIIDDALSFKPFEARKKVVIVDEADTMNISAANAFLKTLEEPPGESLIILISSRPDRLPSTIRSRCSRIQFNTLSPKFCRQIISKGLKTDEVDIVTRLSMGRPGNAFSSDLKEERDKFMNLLKNMLMSEKDGWASREDMEKWFEAVLILIRDMAIIKITAKPSYIINSDILEHIQRLGKSSDIKGIINLYWELSYLKKMLLFNLNKSITWNYASSLLRKELMS